MKVLKLNSGDRTQNDMKSSRTTGAVRGQEEIKGSEDEDGKGGLCGMSGEREGRSGDERVEKRKAQVQLPVYGGMYGGVEGVRRSDNAKTITNN